MPFMISEGDAISFEIKVHLAFKEKIKLTIKCYVNVSSSGITILWETGG